MISRIFPVIGRPRLGSSCSYFVRNSELFQYLLELLKWFLVLRPCAMKYPLRQSLWPKGDMGELISLEFQLRRLAWSHRGGTTAPYLFRLPAMAMWRRASARASALETKPVFSAP